jgi:hypothetical protein
VRLRVATPDGHVGIAELHRGDKANGMARALSQIGIQKEVDGCLDQLPAEPERSPFATCARQIVANPHHLRPRSQRLLCRLIRAAIVQHQYRGIGEGFTQGAKRLANSIRLVACGDKNRQRFHRNCSSKVGGKGASAGGFKP